MTAAFLDRTPLRVVVVDDTDDLRALLRAALVRGGMEVVGEASDGAAGIELVRQTRPDLVLLDLSMPLTEGMEALPQIRELVPHGKVIVVSGFEESAMAERALSAGADGYLQKGIPLTLMLDRIREVTGRHASQAGEHALHVVRCGPAPDPVAHQLATVTAEVEMLRRSIATTAHEIRGPVGLLGAIAETLTDPAFQVDDATLSRLMGSVMRQSRLLDGLTTDLLVAAQARRGTLRVEPRAVDLAAVVGTVVQDADRAGLVAEIEDTRPVLADPLRLEQMLTNLISNAFKYGTPPVVVRVQPADDPDATTVEVVDAGGGVPPDFAGQLFDEFARAPGIGAGGTGLGLYVVRMLAEAHGGSVTYEPAPGGGSVFRITLPVA